jgi:hypothetical protein
MNLTAGSPAARPAAEAITLDHRITFGPIHGTLHWPNTFLVCVSVP